MIRAGLFALFLLQVQLPAVVSFADEVVLLDSDRQFEYADHLLQEGSWEAALHEFNRFLYFFAEDARVDRARLHSAECLFHLERYLDAAMACKPLTRSDTLDEWSVQAFFLQSRAYFAAGDAAAAETTLRNLNLLTNDLQIKDRVHACLGWIYLDLASAGNFPALERFQVHFKAISDPGGRVFKRDEILEEVERIDSLQLKDPGTAGILAAFPGLGFAYCERYRDGLVSFLVNAALIAAAWESFDEGLHAMGGILSFVEAGFYTAGIFGSVTSAQKFNRAAVSAEISRIREILPRTPFQASAGSGSLKPAFVLSIPF